MRYNSKPETTQALLEYDDALAMIKEISGNIPVFQQHHLEALRSTRFGMSEPNLSNVPKVSIDSLSHHNDFKDRVLVIGGGNRTAHNFMIQSIAASMPILNFENIERHIAEQAEDIQLMKTSCDWMIENRLEEPHDIPWFDGEDSPNERRKLSITERKTRKAKQKAVRAARRKSR